MTRLADFTTGTYNGINPTVARSTGGYASKLDGSLQWFAANALRRTNRGALIEKQGVNVLHYSADMTNGAFWDEVYGTRTANAGIAPDGTNTATRLDNTGQAAIDHNGHPVQVTPSVPQRASFFIKPITNTASVYNQWNNNDDGAFAAAAQRFNLATLSDDGVGDYVHGDGMTFSDVVIRALANGWFRCSVTITNNTRSWRGFFGYFVTDGNSPSSAFLWGPQLTVAAEGGSSYYPTFGDSGEVRAGDDVSFVLPSGVNQLVFTFDDDTTQTLSAVNDNETGKYHIPNTFSQRYIKYIDVPSFLYIGGSTRNSRYLGNKTDDQLYLGVNKLFP